MVNNDEKALRRLLEIAAFAAENGGFADAISGKAIAELRFAGCKFEFCRRKWGDCSYIG
jgi:hypothetical protein